MLASCALKIHLSGTRGVTEAINTSRWQQKLNIDRSSAFVARGKELNTQGKAFRNVYAEN
jgi:hypothetical protein